MVLISSKRCVAGRPRWAAPLFVFILIAGVPGTAGAASSPDGIWSDTVISAAARSAETPWVQPTRYRTVELDSGALAAVLSLAPLEFTAQARSQSQTITLPMPDGSFARFTVTDSPIMEPALAAKFPEIRTYSGQGIDDPHATVRMDRTPAGFHAQIFSPSGAVYIDPLFKGNDRVYASYRKRDYAPQGKSFSCLVTGGPETETSKADAASATGAAPRTASGSSSSAVVVSGETLKTYRLAVAATVEYTTFHSTGAPTVAEGLAAIVTTFNRVNQVYENDLAVRMVLVANNSLLVNIAEPDGYTDNDPGQMINFNPGNLDAIIGNSNYDIGHVVSTNGGGVAFLGVICNNSFKGGGVTGTTNPIGDPFDIDFVAHEIGHQFGGSHTWNGVTNSCSAAQRNASTAYEPGSGSTIQAYAGICGSDNLQSNSDPYFHHQSLVEMFAHINTGSGNNCDVATATGNVGPTVNAGGNFTIPAGTPFVLTAVGTDTDPLTYNWEQRDLGPAQAVGDPDNGSSPIFRTFNPTTSPMRYFPRLTDLVNNTTVTGEQLPTTSRTMTFRATVRDNRSGGGGTGFDDMVVTVDNTVGPFLVTAPNAAVTVGSALNVTWDVAGTTGGAVGAANVDILLSTDGGLTYPTALATATPNDGSQAVTLPAVSTTTARIMVRGSGNIFFDISDQNFTITNVPVVFSNGGVTIDDTANNGNGDSMIDPGEQDIALTLNILNGGTGTATNVVATLTSLTPTALIDTGVSAYPNIGSGGNANNTVPFVIDVTPGHPCGADIELQLLVTSTEGMNSFNITLTTASTPGSSVTTSYTGPVVPIPPTGASVDIPFNVSGMGPISDVNFSFDGSSCNTTPGSSTVGLDHTWVGDLVIELISPMGTSIILMDTAGGGTFGSSGNNLCNTVFDDSGASSIQSIPIDGTGAPYTGSFIPLQSLSAFNGEIPAGTWTLRVQDFISIYSGSVRAFSITISGPGTCNIAPPPNSANDWARYE